MLKKLTYIMCAAMVIFSLTTPQASAEKNPFHPVFSDVILDLPIMPGLIEAPENAVIFDKAEGRFVETTAIGTVNPDTITLFYGKALPPLGWYKVTETVFHRNGEALKIDAAQVADKTTVSFILTPQS